MTVDLRTRFRAVVLRCVSAGSAALLGAALSVTTLAAQEAEEELQEQLPESQVSVPPKMIKVVKPRYPEALETMEIEGEIILQAVINSDGKVEARSIRVIKKLHPDLDQASVEALGASEFSPGMIDGHPVRVIMQIPYTYKFRTAEHELTLVEGQASVMPKFTKVVKPTYPEALREREVEGRVVLQAGIDPQGKVEPASVKVLKSVHPEIDQAAVEAVIASEFSPATYKGRPVRVVMQIPYSFYFREVSDRVVVRSEQRGALYHLPDQRGSVVPQRDLDKLVDQLNRYPTRAGVAYVLLWRRGKSTGPDQSLAEAFSPSDTIRAEVKTVNARAGTGVLARWVYLEGNSKIVITESTHLIDDGGTDVTQFSVGKPTPWPAGTYELEVGLDGKIQGTARFKVGL